MKLPFSWLKEFIKVDKTPEKLGEALTLSGLEVEQIIQPTGSLKDIVVGEIKTVIKHPHSDKLKICKVRVKKGKVLKIVCGAQNIKVGQKVPTALVGAKLPNGVVLEKAKIRGVDSEGMLLAEDELGIGDDHQGIYILDQKETVGKSVKSILGLNETVFEIDITPNRADCLSIQGLAREVSAVTKRKLKPRNFQIKEKKNEIKDLLKVEVKNPELCSKYTCRIIKGIQIKDSPEWLKNRLRACGIRPINNIVDVSNYVMLELGQPLHAFDAKIVGKKIVVRTAKSGEKMVTLDNQTRHLDSSMLVIADSKKSIAIAGVMGGLSSEISNKTQDVILESAIFDSKSVRHTSQKLDLVSDSSLRFEKGLDWNATEVALDRAAQLMAKLGSGKVVPGFIKVAKEPKDLNPVIKLSLERIKLYLNLKFTSKETMRILRNLGFEIKLASKDILEVKIPSWRPDVRLEEDLIEEIGRIYDYNKLKPTFLTGKLKPVQLPKELACENKIKDLMARLGFSEVYHYSFYGEDLAKKCGLEPHHHLRVANPLNPDQALMRITLMPRMFETAAKNAKEFDQFKIFEIGKVFLPQKGELPDEQTRFLALVLGKDGLLEIKGVLAKIFEEVNIQNYSFLEMKDKLMIYIDKKAVGFLSKSSPILKNAFKIKKDFAYLALDCSSLIKLASESKKYQPISIFPEMVRDLAFFVEEGIRYEQIEKEIKDIDPLLTKIELFDVYEKEGKKSLALRLFFQSKERTLKSEEVDKLMDKINKILENKFKIKVRK